MKAIVQDRYGSPDRLTLTEVDRPVPGDNEVLVRVHAAAVNAYDWHVMRGDPYLARLMMPSAFGPRGPKRRIRGRDIAGRVDAVGPAVTRLRPGDEVYGDLGHAGGAFAEYAAVPEDAVDHKPANLTFAQAAAVPLAANTALMGLRDLARVRPGRRVLINGASGGVGTFAVQIAKAFGAVVTAVCSTRNVSLMERLGADRVVDYTREDFARDGSYDVVFDLVGNRTLRDLRRVLTPTGTLVFSGGGVSGGGRPHLVGPMGLTIRGQLAARLVRQRLLLLTEKPSAANLAALRELIESGRVTPVIDQTYPLDKASEAIRYVEVEHARGKVVITI
jgi:NADPH:quinone reductase-like Zn-dependent oxidoreductase